MGNIISGIGSMIGEGKAASAAGRAAGVMQNQLATTTGYLSPYITAGQNVLQPLQTLATSGPTGGGPDYVAQAAANVPLQMTQAQLEQTPGYQFTLGQGLKTIQAMNAARGLGASAYGASGAEMRGAATYATGLANRTYKDQFDIGQQRFTDYLNLSTGQQAQLTNQMARLQGVANMGVTAGSNLAQTGAELATGQANALTAQGAAQAAQIAAPFKGFGADVNSVLGMPTSASGPATAANPQGTPAGPSIMQNWLSKIA